MLIARFKQLPRDSRDTVFLLAVVAWIIVPHASHVPWWTLVLALGALFWRSWLAWQARALPARGWLLALLAVALTGTLLSHHTLLGREAGVTLVVVLLALKTLELRARRDAFVVFFLGFFTLLTHFLYSQSLPTAAAMLIALLGLLTALVNAHMPVGQPPLKHSVGIALRMVLLGTPIMAALFVFFPRVAPLWGVPDGVLRGRSGLSSHMEIGNLAQMVLDESIAMRVRFESPGGAPPPQAELYFRGPVFSRFDGREWKLPDPMDALVLAGADQGQRLQVSGPAIRYEVTLEAHQQPWLLVLDAADQPPQAPGLQATLTPELQWVRARPVTELLRYRAVSHTQFRYGPLSRTTALQAYTQLPPGFNPRTLQWAQDLRRDPRYAQADAAALTQFALQHLAQGGYTYTLEPGVYGQHTADEFWFDRKTGFCEHIASAFVVLMRALDVPARLVTGYQGGASNPLDGFWEVRQSDAHAWAEVWQEGAGWVRVDPTGAVSPARVGTLQRLQAPRGAIAQALITMSPGLAQQVRAAWDAMNNRWNQWVLNYSQARQFDLLRALGFESPDWKDLGWVLASLAAAAGALGGVWGLAERRRQDPWLRLLQQMRQTLQGRGLRVADTATPRALAQAVQASYGDKADALHTLLLRLERQRYAPPGPDAHMHLRALQQKWRQLRHALPPMP